MQKVIIKLKRTFQNWVIHTVRTHKGGGEGSSQTRTIAFKGGRFQGCVSTQKSFFLDRKISKLFFFCTKEAITLSFIIVYRKV